MDPSPDPPNKDGYPGGTTISTTNSSNDGTSLEPLLGVSSVDCDSPFVYPSPSGPPLVLHRHNTGYEEVDIEGPFSRVVASETFSPPPSATSTGTPRFLARARAALLGTRRQERDHQHRHSWEFAGWGGNVQDLDFTGDLLLSSPSGTKTKHQEHVRLGQLTSTSICGNDIMASVLYTTGLVLAKAGKLAPVCMVLVVFVLFLFRKIYGEAVCALPLNGGSYNVLLNATKKDMAAICACLSILAYLATGVVSARSASGYLQCVWTTLNVEYASIVLLGIFAILTFLGISESANVATVIFVVHMATLTLLVVLGLAFACFNTDIFHDNIQQPYPDVDVNTVLRGRGTVFTALFYGFSSAMLGVSGFETSANFVEEQAPGVFPKTLRNMWLGVSIYNPLLVFLALFTAPIDEMAQPDDQDKLLANMGRSFGSWMGGQGFGETLYYLVAIDAFVVLSGSILTSFVGVVGLVRRLAMDRCFPAIVLIQNKWRGTNHVIIFGFFFIASSLVLILKGDVEDLAAVYTMAFLSVMSFFSLGTMLLKFKRPDLRRTIICPWWMAIMGLLLVFLAFIGNVMGNAAIVPYFILYYSIILIMCFVMFQRVRLLKLLVVSLRRWKPRMRVSYLVDLIRSINEEPFLYLAKTPELYLINKALLYVRDNEQTSRVLVVHFYDQEDPQEVRRQFSTAVEIIDRIYPKITVNLLLIHGKFSPASLDRLSYETGIPHHRFFLACPNSIENLWEYGGVRIITH